VAEIQTAAVALLTTSSRTWYHTKLVTRDAYMYGDEKSETDDEDGEEVLACAYLFARGRLVARHLNLQIGLAGVGAGSGGKRPGGLRSGSATRPGTMSPPPRSAAWSCRTCPEATRHKLVCAKKLFVDWLETRITLTTDRLDS